MTKIKQWIKINTDIIIKGWIGKSSDKHKPDKYDLTAIDSTVMLLLTIILILLSW